mmetsp:Transcript_16378/g.34222  ORF Transcript_16378/g.34222 Transcript_16378/m.34222 type:complete len:278 (-) Transcript_16378:32-865(-)
MLDIILNNPTAALLTGAVAVLLLPESMAVTSEVVWAVREYLRRNLRQLVQLTVQGPLFKLFVLCARRCCRGHLSSLCSSPHSLRAQAVSESDLVLCWVARSPPSNPFHEEHYVCAWCLAEDAGEAPVRWHEHETLEADNCGDDPDGGRRAALLERLPEGVQLRLRVCAQNRHGRGDWSEEVEIEMPTEQAAMGARHHGAKVLARSRVVASSGRRCLQCQRAQPLSKPVAYASVECPPIFSRECPHGPFCARCRKAVSAQVLPACICRGLIGTWREAA